MNIRVQLTPKDVAMIKDALEVLTWHPKSYFKSYSRDEVEELHGKFTAFQQAQGQVNASNHPQA